MKKRTSRLVSLLTTTALCVGLLAGCGSGSSSSTSSTSSDSSKKTYKIAWCNNSSSDDYQVALTNTFDKYKSDYNMEIVKFDAQADTQTQANQVLQAVSQKVDAILITPNDAVGLGTALKEAHDAGIKVITTATDVGEDYRQYRDCFVGPNDTTAGELAGKAMVEAFPNGGKVVMIEGQAGYDAQIKRTDGFKKAIEGSKVELLDAQACSAWDANEAMKIMEDFVVKYGDQIQGVFCQWDVGTAGAVQAIEASSLKVEDLNIVSIDGCKEGVDNVKSGKVDTTIMQDMDGIGKGTLDATYKILNGEKVDSEINPDLIVVNKDNCNDYNPTW